MYLKVNYDVKIDDHWPKDMVLKLAEDLADMIAGWAEEYGVEATGIVESQEESDG